MIDQIDQRLRDYFDEATSAVPVSSPTRFRPTSLIASPATSRRVRPLAIVAFAAAIVTVAGLFVIRGRESSTVPSVPAVQSPVPTAAATEASIPITDPHLFAPATLATVSVVSRQVYSPAPGGAGAVIAPDGRIFGISLGPLYDDSVPSGDLRRISGFDVRALTDGTAPDEIYRTIEGRCLSLGITTAGETAFSANTEVLIGGLTIQDEGVDFAVPGGWSSLGASANGIQYGLDLLVSAGDTTTDLTLFEMPDAPVAAYLTTSETAPQAVDIDGETAWAIPSATTTGYTTLVGERDGTAFSISGRATAAELVAIAESFVRVPLADWTTQTPDTTTETTHPAPAGCTIPPLTITSR